MKLNRKLLRKIILKEMPKDIYTNHDLPYEFGEEEISAPGGYEGLLGDPELAPPDYEYVSPDDAWRDRVDRDVKQRANRPRPRIRRTPSDLMKITRTQLRKLIKEMYHSRRNAAFSRAQASYDAMTPHESDRDPPSANVSDEAILDTLLAHNTVYVLEDIADSDSGYLNYIESDDAFVNKDGIVVAMYENVPGPMTMYADLVIVDQKAAEDIIRKYYSEIDIPDRLYDLYDEIISQDDGY
tara:strand:+ start:4565 stop:5284 length:720 start_codon:yes stop_codon:yes gene_type:complete